MPSKPSFYNIWVRLSGDPEQFPLNARIFHSICLISILALGYNVPFNYFIGLPEVALASFIVLLISGAIYYASLFRGKVTISIFLFNILGLSLFTVNYLFNSGQEGPTDLFFLLFLLITIGISPVNQYKIWIPVNIILFLSLNISEYLDPTLVPNTYDNRFTRFVDHISAYLVVAAITYFCIDYIRISYEREKASAVEKAKAIEQKNEQILKQNHELERLNSEKNKLMSIVAHDLRSPLGSIQSFLELLSEHELDADEKQNIESDLLTSTKSTLAMLSKLLDWSKSQLHGIAARREYLNLAKVFEPTLKLEQEIAARKDIVLEYDFNPIIMIYADSDMMQLILRNIVGNAIKFTKRGGSIVITADIKGSDCLITIQDNGIGMPPEKQAAIFSLNVQSSFGTNNEKGIGLGLLLCMEFVRAQNGKLWFTSSPEKGTCFYISIPIVEQNYLWPSGLS
ncbi:HAMP domain-containing histidine kinase [Dyadobacter luticola]|uniref:histidine kinase n=1 Tax=Dyadobacter luticola TaxID=1979387 RepID=A0A5R9L670_9BACT|nr:HAMP domain-containing histidine kinase [Dyadobacter luticola]